MVTVSEYPKAICTFMLVLFILICFGACGIEAQTRRIPADEMAALSEIAEQLGKKDWNLSLNHCDEYTPISPGIYNNIVNCNCSSADECHISVIILTGQGLSGVLPRSIVKLPYLKTMWEELPSSKFIGPLPPEWASTKLEHIFCRYLSMNHISGTIPKFLGSITSLTNLCFEGNMFNGTVPAELGNLVDLLYLNLNTNNLTGELPKEFSNLINLRELRLSSNNFNGKLPSFQSCEQLRILELEASGFEGPIPSDVSLLLNLTEIRITDLNGGASEFPKLENTTALEKLMLRNCNISGTIPVYLANFSLRYMDLSFNRLEGNIPNFEGALHLQNMYLTRNLLNGSIPAWITSRDSRYVIDLSYNNFIMQVVPCKDTLNLFRSFSGGNLEISECLKVSPCPKQDGYSLHINCGGGQTKVGNTMYVADELQGGPATLQAAQNWGFSSTGHFWDVNANAKYYTTQNVSVLTMNESQLYTSARLSPLSLTYYGRCLANGNYTVTLHFAEIVFRDDGSYQSLGRRIFDVYIQDELVLKDFDIEAVAQGVDKAVVRKFNNTVVKNKTIEIRFYWAGKGTRAVPIRGIYGPLISAISIESNFKPHSDQRKKIVIVVGAVTFSLCLVFTILFTFWRRGHSKSITSREQGPKEWQLNLGWPTRLRICIGIARGLASLHEESRLKIVHRDIKATNVLLDGDLNPKISDFGLAKLTEDDNTHISTRVAGTIGYMAPEYALWGYLSNKADVYSFGIVALEIAAGKDNMKFRTSDKYVCLLDWALVLQQKGRLMELVDPKLGPDFDKEEAIKMIKIALLCTNPSPAHRPAMSAIVSMLEGHLDIQDLVMDPSIYGDEYRFRSLKDKYDELQLQSSNEAQSLIDSTVTTQIGSSSASTNDLYQINLDSA
ncbi:probable LRR receptor-like serine/threonine-protein kinase At1g07650 isoform X9 [Camellia sinensis]|uniref:probable LRR receptor-like serine/threonine-protein kinase At1g07650 isoform X9 n=1 Tax=Camellia sinensis TaxID=4442 RepID=UPI0010367D23|nr:probable LRR receptor-like serine/threonine-protein kinase At1g07650 isoform X9 [Camellia sinensis]